MKPGGPAALRSAPLTSSVFVAFGWCAALVRAACLRLLIAPQCWKPGPTLAAPSVAETKALTGGGNRPNVATAMPYAEQSATRHSA